jgi:hypothetical protein
MPSFLRMWLITCCCLTVVLAGRVQAAEINEGSPAWQELMGTSLGDDVLEAFQWRRVLQRTDRPELADALQKVLVWRYLQRAIGEPPGLAPTIAQALQLAASLPALETFSPQLNEVLTKQLKPQWLTEPAPWPDEWKSDAQDVRVAAPGLWWRDGRPMALVFDLINPGPLPLAMHTLQISAPGVPGGFVCMRPAQQPLSVLAPGSSTRLHCISNIVAAPGEPRYAAAVAAFSAGSRAALVFMAAAPGEAKPVLDFARFIETRGGGVAAESKAFDARNRDCKLRGSCSTAAAQVEAPPAPPQGPRLGTASRNWLIIISAFWLYCGLARWLGNNTAKNGAFILGTTGLFSLFSGFGAGVGTMLTRDTSALAGIGIIVGILGGLLWGWIASRVMHWLYGILFSDEGVITAVYRKLRRDLGGAQRVRGTS